MTELENLLYHIRDNYREEVDNLVKLFLERKKITEEEAADLLETF